MRGRLIAADGNVCLLMLMLCEGSSGEIPAATTQKQKEKQQQQPTKRLHHHVAWIRVRKWRCVIYNSSIL